MICSRLARVVSMGSPRKPSLPPNSTMVTRGLCASTSLTRATPSVVVLPLTPRLTTRHRKPAASRSFCKKSGKLLPGSAPNPAVKLSPNATITERVSLGVEGGAAIPNCTKPIAPTMHPTKRSRSNDMHATQCHNKKLEAAAVRPPAIQVSNLTKSIPTATHRVDILRGIDLEIQLG